MGLLTTDESRLVFALLLNALVMLGAWRAARRINSNLFDAAGDGFLLFYLVQYLSVGVPGLVGALHPLTIGAVAVLLSGAIGLAGSFKRSTAPPSPGMAIPGRSLTTAVAASLFVIGYVAALVWHQRQVPVLSNDAITYHLPAAVQWLQTGRLGFYEAWFYNPANSYSPLAGSAFIAWLLAPLGNDAVARFVQAGPLVMLFVGLLNLCRRLGADAGVAALIAAACVLARPLVGQTILSKDDLFVAAFFVMGVNGLSRERLDGPFGAWRVGVSLGLLFATKFTVLLSAPILLLVIGRGWTWRRVAIVGGCMLVLAGPWYLRNLVLTGNPLYPTRVAGLPGMLDVHRSAMLATAAGAWKVFTSGYYAFPVALAAVMIGGWLAGAIVARSNVWRDRLVRTCVIGPVIGIALFVALAPYGEMRFAYPSVVLMFAAMAIALRRLPGAAAYVAATVVLLISAATAFNKGNATFMAVGAGFAIVGAAAAWAAERGVPMRKIAPAAIALVILVLGLYGYVNWRAYLRQCAFDSAVAWRESYGPIGDVWAFVRDQAAPRSTIAYANTYFTYPLMGYAYDHRVVHAPTRRDVEAFVDMPSIAKPMTGEEIVANIVRMLRQDPDRERWLERLKRTGAQYLVVQKQLAEISDTTTPPEIIFAQQDGQKFVPVFENEAGVVYEIRQ